jgi:hypothetical protein
VKFGRLLEGAPKPKGKVQNLENFALWGPKWGDGKCRVLQYTGTNGQDKKHSLQRSFEIIKKTRAKNRYIC